MRKREANRDVIVVEREGGSAIWWLLAGGALGAGLALLFAPGPGVETRKKVSARFSKLRESAEEVLEGLRDRIDPDEQVHRSLTDADGDTEPEEEEPEEGAGGRPVAGGRGSSPARQELEQRLAEARARRQRALAEEDEEPVA
ncbi:MAG TPA: YtxH domain-containing protein [Gemmatimonadales bacterium]|nr:YtxH domain-containing protein [Gemmatimonadales bacterium]